MKILPNGIAILEQDTHISKWIEDSGRLDHDRNVIPIFTELIREGGVALDIGAFIGDHTVSYATRAKRVIAIEPNPEAYECLVHNIQFFENIVPMNCAIGDRTGFVHLQKQLNAGATFIEGVSDHGIPLVRLDELEFDTLDFVKVDVEGYELKVLRGGINTFRKLKPIVALEINLSALCRNGDSLREIQALMLGDFGYSRFETIPRVTNLYTEPQYDVIYHP